MAKEYNATQDVFQMVFVTLQNNIGLGRRRRVLLQPSMGINFRSAIAFGPVRIIEDDAEKMAALEILGRRCNPHNSEGLAKEIARGFSRCTMLEMSIERLTGKQAIELAKRQ